VGTMTDPIILFTRDKEEPGVEHWWDGSCPNCGEPLDEPDVGDIHIEPGEFISIKQHCACGLSIDNFYDWDRTERLEK
jgi:hypothetical protein